MKKLLKIVAGLAIVLSLAPAGLTVFIRAKFPPERIKALAAEQVKARLHREMRLENVSLGLFKGVSLTGFELSERPDFSAGTFVASRSLSVKPRLLPLLRGRLEAGSVELVEPSIRIVRRADGTFNFSDLASTAPAAAAGSPPPGEPPRSAAPPLFVGRLAVEKGTLAFEDLSAQPADIRVEELDLSLDGFSLLAPFRAKLSCRWKGRFRGAPMEGRLRFAGRLNLFAGGAAEVETFTLDSGGTSLAASGSVRTFSRPQADIRLKIKSFETRTLAPFMSLPPWALDTKASGEMSLQGGLADSRLRAGLDLSAPGARTRLELESQLKDLPDRTSFDANLRFSGLTWDKGPLLPDLRTEGPLEGSAKVRGTLKAVHAEARLDGGRAVVRYGSLASKEAGGTLLIEAAADLREPFSDPSFEVRGRIEKLTLASAPPLPSELKLKGPVSAVFTARGTPARIAAEASLEGRDLEAAYGVSFTKPAGVPLSLAAEGALTDGQDADLSSLRLTLGESVLQARGRIKDAAGAGRMDLSVQSPGLSFGSLSSLVPLIKEYRLSGKAGVAASMKGTYAAPEVQGTLALKGLEAVPVEGLAFTDLTGPVTLTQDSMSSDGLRGKFNGSDLALKIRLQNFSRPDLRLDGSLATLDAGGLLAAFSNPPSASGAGVPSPAGPAPSAPDGPAPIARTSGRFRIDTVTHPHFLGRQFNLTWDLTAAGPDMGRSNGTAEFTAADGKIRDLPLAAKINKLLKKDASEIPYDRMAGHFQVTRGVLETPDFTVNSPQADIAVKGTVNLTSLAADLRATLKLPKGSVGGSVGGYFADEDGRPTVEAAIRGPLSDPQVTPDLSRALKRAAEDQIKKGLEKLGLGGRPSSPPAGPEAPDAPAAPPPPAEKPVDRAIEQGQKALEKLFRKKK